MFKITKGCKFILTGDSITDAGRSPNGEGLFDPLGSGYVQYANALINSICIDSQIRCVNVGVSGSTSRDLLTGWDDIMCRKPDWISVMIGINDIWRHFDSELFPENQVNIHEYEANLTEIIKKTVSDVQGMVLMTPFFCELNKSDEMRSMTDAYGNVVKKLADTYNCIYVDVQSEIDNYLQYHHPSSISWDRVHVNNVGHMIIARTLMKSLGLEM